MVKNKLPVPPPQYPKPLPEISSLKADAHVISARMTKHGPSENWGLDQWAQYALSHLYPGGVPKHLNKSKLGRDVNDWLGVNADYLATNHKDGRGKPRRLNRLTVLRAAGLLMRSRKVI